MRDELQEVLELQATYSATTTPEMHRRGVLVRSTIPAQLRLLLPTVTPLIPDAAVQGKDGAGQKTEIPWIRVHSAGLSPSATTGWYVVYLFAGDGSHVYLSLNQGTTRWDGSQFRPRSHTELSARVGWARRVLSDGPAATWVQDIDLVARTRLGQGYERGNVCALEYARGAIPPDQVIREDLVSAVGHLSTLYRSEAVGIDVPGESPDVADAREQLDAIAGKRTPGPARPRLTAAERKAIELRAVAVSTHFLEQRGYDVTDVGSHESYDLHALPPDGGSALRVEVKGTTSSGSEVVLTRNEVNLHRESHPDNALAVVHGITLHRGDVPTASGGTLEFEQPWLIDEGDLQPLAFTYTTGL